MRSRCKGSLTSPPGALTLSRRPWAVSGGLWMGTPRYGPGTPASGAQKYLLKRRIQGHPGPAEFRGEVETCSLGSSDARSWQGPLPSKTHGRPPGNPNP